jgi:hypothetical protein
MSVFQRLWIKAGTEGRNRNGLLKHGTERNGLFLHKLRNFFKKILQKKTIIISGPIYGTKNTK